MSTKLSVATAIAVALAASSASAAGIDDMFNVRGYATLGVVHSDNDQADFVSGSLTQSEGAGYTDSWSANVDSRLGVQVDANFTDRLTGVVQVISEAVANNTFDGDLNENYHPSVEWANLSYRVTDDLTVRAGRIVLPFLGVAEFRKVGFAQTWIRPPVEMYSNVPFSSSDGADVTYRSRIGGAINTARVHYGTQSLRMPMFKAQVEAYGANDTIEIGSLSVRAAYMLVNVNDSLDFKHYGAGFTYDPGNWFTSGEWMKLEATTNTTAVYVTGGVRLGKFTPYATYAQYKAGSVSSMSGVKDGQHSLGAGLRWDFMANFALKAQYDQVALNNGSTGQFTNVQPGFEPGGDVNVFSVSLDYVF